MISLAVLKPWIPDVIERLTITQFGRRRLREHLVLHQLVSNLVAVDAASVIAHMNDDVVSAVRRLQADRSHLGLAGRRANIGWLQTMIEGVSHQMNQRVAQFIDHAFIEFRLFTTDFQMDAFSAFFGQVSNNAFKAIEERCDGNHSCIEYAFLQTLGHTCQLIDRFAILLDLASIVFPRGEVLIHRPQSRPSDLSTGNCDRHCRPPLLRRLRVTDESSHRNPAPR